MAKKIIRETIIMLLLCIAIILLLGVVLYTYTPGNKTMPEKVSYTIPAEVKKELDAAELTESEQVILTYEVNSNDLTNYQRVKNYNPGKPNPFSSIEEKTTETELSETGNTGSNSSSNSSNNSGNTVAQNTTTTKSSTTVENNETSKYSHDKGTK